MTTPARSRSRRREEVRFSLSSSLLVLVVVVVWELPLKVEGATGAEGINAVGAPPAPSTPVAADDAYRKLIGSASSEWIDDKYRLFIGDGRLSGVPAVMIGGAAPGPVPRLVDILMDLIGAILGGITQVVGRVYSGVCGVWQALIKFVRDQVDFVMQSVFGLIDRGCKWKTTKAIMGFVDMALDMASYPKRWVVAFASSSPLGHCFHITFYPCIKERPHTLPTYVRCGFRLSSKCGFYDMFFRYRESISFGKQNRPPSSSDAAPPAG